MKKIEAEKTVTRRKPGPKPGRRRKPGRKKMSIAARGFAATGKVSLGSRVHDSISGFSGVVVQRLESLHDHPMVKVVALVSYGKDGPTEAWFAEARVIVDALHPDRLVPLPFGDVFPIAVE